MHLPTGTGLRGASRALLFSLECTRVQSALVCACLQCLRFNQRWGFPRDNELGGSKTRLSVFAAFVGVVSLVSR